MKQTATIKLVEASRQQTITLEEVKKFFQIYRNRNAMTGQQLDWNYAGYTFPYEMTASDSGLFLRSEDGRYHSITVLVADNEIQFVLTEQSAYGDKAKANEFIKLLGKALQGEVHLFNRRVMYFYPRK